MSRVTHVQAATNKHFGQQNKKEKYRDQLVSE